MERRDVHPPPPIEELSKIQLMRTTLVKFIETKNFDEIVQGCFVRVLLEMRKDGHRDQGPDQYYIAQVKGAKEGPSYSGFSWEKTTTKWHIIIELPPCFRATPNGNVIQLNSISNTPFKPGEYQAWVEMSKQNGGKFIQLPQIQLRMSLLEEHKLGILSPNRNARRRHKEEENPELVKEREAKIAAIRLEQTTEIKNTHFFLPHEDSLGKQKVSQLMEVERECLDILSSVRLAINERTKCRICKAHICTVICYPCKHQVTCPDCAEHLTHCPAPNCQAVISDKFEAFSS